MSSIKTNYLLNISYQVLTLIVPLVTTPYLSRVIGAEGIGVFSYTNSIAYYFVLIAMLGVNTYGNRSIARVRDDLNARSTCFWGIFYFQLLVTAISCVAFGVFACKSQYSQQFLLWLFYIVSAGFDISWFFFGLEEFKITVTRNFVVKLISVCLIFLLVKSADDLNLYISIISISYIVTQLMLWPFLVRRVHFRLPCWKEIGCHIKPNLVLFIPSIAISLYTTTSKVLLGCFSTMVQTAYFENTEKIVRMPLSLITALGVVMLPRMSYLENKGKKKEAADYLDFSLWFAQLLSVALAFGLAGISEVFAPVFFGDQFSECAGLIRLLCVNTVIMAWSNVLRTQCLIPRGMDRLYVVAISFGAVVNVVLCCSLLPSFGALGAVISSVVAEGVAWIVQLVGTVGCLKHARYFKQMIPMLLIGFIMSFLIAIVGQVLPANAATLCVQIIVGMISYGLMCLAYYSITRNQHFARLVKRIPIVKSYFARIR